MSPVIPSQPAERASGANGVAPHNKAAPPIVFTLAQAQSRAIGVFLASFAVAFSYNVFLVRGDIKDAFACVKTKLYGVTKLGEKRRD